jgi:hypothetical protein
VRELWAPAPVEERRLLSNLPGRLDFRQRLSTPEIAEHLDRRWSRTCRGAFSQRSILSVSRGRSLVICF